MSRLLTSDTRTPAALLQGTWISSSEKIGHETYRSVAILSFSIALRSSLLVAADRLVIGVLAVLPLALPVGVPTLEDASVLLPLLLAAPLAAFSARRFCLEAEGAMSSKW